MIFVTVGTHEQQFNRLIEEIDRLKGNGTIKDEVIMQTGYCTYKPKYCKWSELLPYDQMLENVEKADIVITHGDHQALLCHYRLERFRLWYHVRKDMMNM